MASHPARFDKIFLELKGLETTAKGWKCRCPAHDDRSPSMDVWITDDGWLGLYCYAGCTREDILHSIGCVHADLGPERSGGERVERYQKTTITNVYSYCDEEGRELYQVVRMEPKGFRQRKKEPDGSYTYSVSGVRKVLYHLDELTAQPKRMVFIVEGEKDVDNLRDLKLLATCNAGGAGKWLDGYTESLKGRHVCLIPDHDKEDAKLKKRPGWEHVDMVAKRLIGHVASLRIVQLAVSEGQDISDWLANGGSRAKLEALARSSPIITHPEMIPTYQPTPSPSVPEPVTSKRRGRKVTLRGEELSSAAHKGVMRILRRIKNKGVVDHQSWSAEIEQACGEQAVKKASHRYFVGAVGTYQDNPCPGKILQVRYEPHDNGLCRLNEDDHDDDIFVFVTGHAPTYIVHGWIKGVAGKTEKYKTEDVYHIPTPDLLDLSELPPELDDDEQTD